MEQKKNNQERGEPSKAPRQDEDGREFVGRADPETPKYNSIGEQGISNRPAEVEHAFPDSDETLSEPLTPDSVESTPKQQGGNRGGV